MTRVEKNALLPTTHRVRRPRINARLPFHILLGLLAGSVGYAFEPVEINPPAAPATGQTLALVGGRLIDGRGGPPVEDAAVVVRGNSIVAVGPRATVVVPGGAKIVDVGGLSILPGLIDSHFHSQHTVVTPVEYELKHGVTTFRDPGHPFHFYDLVRASTEPMPRVFLCGGHLDGPPPVWPDQAVLIRDAAQARQAVQDHVDHGASAIKVYFRLPLDYVRAACEAAAERGVRVTAHLELVDADDAIRAGVRGIEHVTSFGTALAEAGFANEFRAKVRADSGARNQLRHWLWSKIELDRSTRIQPLLDLIVDNNVFVSPTLAIFERRAGEKDGTVEDERAFATMLRFVGMCHRAGAKVVVGSHTAAPFAETGRAYQRELELLIEAGLTPLEAITAGTLQSARFFGIENRLGTLEAGKTADLILVDGNPAADIAALNNVRRVMLNGRWIGAGP